MTAWPTSQYWNCGIWILCILLIRLIILDRYQFNPELYNPDVVINILIKALIACPLPDFNLCISLLDERPINSVLDEPDPLPTYLPILQRLYDLLQSCQFPLFWKTFHSDELQALRDNYTVECVGFEDAIRQIVNRAVTATFTNIGAERLASYTDLSGKFKFHFVSWQTLNTLRNSDTDLPHWVAQSGWSYDKSKRVIAVPQSLDTQLESTVVQEDINLLRQCNSILSR